MQSPIAIECQWSARDFDATSLRAFRGRYPGGENFLVASDVTAAVTRRYGDLPVRIVSLTGLVNGVAAHRAR